jgi:prepilin-type N-terminal cleavage/methylation domain-containing protein
MNRRAFTLLEIMIAMSLFTLVGFAVVLLMGSGVDMWIQGTRGSQSEDRREMSLPLLEDDLRMVRIPNSRDRIPADLKGGKQQQELAAIVPKNRFTSGYIQYKFGEREIPCRYVSFVRSMQGLGEIEMFAGRAGTNPKGDAYIDGTDDEKEFKENKHRATGGEIEVLWIWLPDGNEPGLGTVYRAYRSPVGGKGTLLDPKNYADRGALMRVINPQPVFQDVLMFDLYFWTQFTTTWEYVSGDPRVTSRTISSETSQDGLSEGPPPCGPSRSWDSTRGLQVAGPNAFRLNKTDKSANYAADDIWPRAIRIEFALKEMQSELKSSLSASAASFSVHDAQFATGMGIIYNMLFKVGPEWVRVHERDARDPDTFVLSGRGERGTVQVNHAADTPVYFGRVYDVTVRMPAFRDDNN